MNLFRKWMLEVQLRRVKHEMEQLENFRARSGAHLDRLIRHAANLQAELWLADNPRPPAGTNLHGLNSRQK